MKQSVRFCPHCGRPMAYSGAGVYQCIGCGHLEVRRGHVHRD